MTRTQRLSERAINFAIAEANEDLAVARLAFLAHGDHAALDEAIEACLARRDRSLPTSWPRTAGGTEIRSSPARMTATACPKSASGMTISFWPPACVVPPRRGGTNKPHRLMGQR